MYALSLPHCWGACRVALHRQRRKDKSTYVRWAKKPPALWLGLGSRTAFERVSAEPLLSVYLMSGTTALPESSSRVAACFSIASGRLLHRGRGVILLGN
jgi:hypothetical protein